MPKWSKQSVVAAALILTGLLAAGQTFPAYRAPRFPGTENPDLNGIWQAVNSADWDLEAHAAGSSPFPALLGAEPSGQSVVEGGKIPYQLALDFAQAAVAHATVEHWLVLRASRHGFRGVIDGVGMHWAIVQKAYFKRCRPCGNLIDQDDGQRGLSALRAGLSACISRGELVPHGTGVSEWEWVFATPEVPFGWTGERTCDPRVR